jgi:hypothetical protein
MKATSSITKRFDKSTQQVSHQSAAIKPIRGFVAQAVAGSNPVVHP